MPLPKMMAAKKKSGFRLFGWTLQTPEQRKLRWGSLLFISIIAFVLFTNSKHTNIQSDAIAKEMLPEPVLPTDLQAVNSLDNAEPASTHQPSDSSLGENGTDDRDNEAALTEPYTYSWAVRSGDTLSDILQRFDVHSALGDILALGQKARPLLNLKAGKKMHLNIIRDGHLEQLVYETDKHKHLILSRAPDGEMTLEERILPVEKHEVFAAGFVDDSFYHAALRVGIPDKIIIEAANVLAWDIDFALNIRKGDFFAILYEEKSLNGERISFGNVLGVEFINQGKTYRAIRYTDQSGKTGYFMPDGRNVKKPFLRTPLEFTRISSHFNPRRLHPILGIVRPHRGVDYAAPTGTPIHATADGTVIFRGWKAGYGNTVILRHHGAYTTLYAHLSKFARIRNGTKVKQKQIIGYVGTTGYATGPHLHYEFRVNGRHKNPVSVKLPASKPLPKSAMAHFKQATGETLAKLDILNKSYITLNQ